jgi:hypothetical protein
VTFSIASGEKHRKEIDTHWVKTGGKGYKDKRKVCVNERMFTVMFTA